MSNTGNGCLGNSGKDLIEVYIRRSGVFPGTELRRDAGVGLLGGQFEHTRYLRVGKL